MANLTARVIIERFREVINNSKLPLQEAPTFLPVNTDGIVREWVLKNLNLTMHDKDVWEEDVVIKVCSVNVIKVCSVNSVERWYWVAFRGTRDNQVISSLRFKTREAFLEKCVQILRSFRNLNGKEA